MNCIHCGNPLEEGEKFCGYCGQPAEAVPAPPKAPESPLEDLPTVRADELGVPVIEWFIAREGEDPIALEERVMLGRGSDSDVKLDDTEASRAHALIEKVEDGYIITDQGSTNGTFVNEERTEGPVALNDGDVIRIGNTPIAVTATGLAAPQACPSCGQAIEPGVTFCGSCGQPISAEAKPRQVATPQPVVGVGQAVQSEDDIKQIAEEGQEPPPPNFRLPRRGLLIGCGVMIVLGIAIACCVSTVGSGVLESILDYF